MLNNLLDIALVLFTRTPEEEVRVKNFVPQVKTAQQLAIAEKLIQHGKNVLAATGLPYFICSSAAQKGESFGERLQDAFDQLFAQGFEKVILIGNDCPALKPADVLKAARKLQEQDAVVGPDARGGVYLLGLTRAAFYQNYSFQKIRWNTPWVLTDIAQVFRLAPADLSFLNQYNDLNNGQEFIAALQRRLFRPALIRFFRLLLRMLSSKIALPEKLVLTFFKFSNLSFRGPPVLKY